MNALTSKVLFAIAALAAFAVTPARAGPNLSGSHYNLNIQGKTNCAGSDLTGSNRHTIQVLLNYHDQNYNGVPYVDLDRRNKIFLSGGTDFQVLDGNACDSGGAQFQLPYDVATSWKIYARALAKPGGSATMTLCGVDDMGTATTADDVIFCNTGDDVVSLKRYTGKPQWQDVTKELTHLNACVDLNNDAVVAADECVDVNVFDPTLYEYFWDYDNWGLRLTQLRFYPANR